MLFQVEMTVRLPHDMPASASDALKKVEREKAQETVFSELGRILAADSWR